METAYIDNRVILNSTSSYDVPAKNLVFLSFDKRYAKTCHGICVICTLVTSLICLILLVSCTSASSSNFGFDFCLMSSSIVRLLTFSLVTLFLVSTFILFLRLAKLWIVCGINWDIFDFVVFLILSILLLVSAILSYSYVPNYATSDGRIKNLYIAIECHILIAFVLTAVISILGFYMTLRKRKTISRPTAVIST